MAIDYPTALDSFTDKQDNVDVVQAVDINNVQDACMALEEKVGIDDSEVTTSHDYKISRLEGHLENIVFAKDYDSFADAVSDIGTSNATTLITSTSLTLTANVTVSGNINIVALEGTSFSGAYTLTFNGPFQAGLYQVFDDDVTVKFGSGAINNIYPEWWGARSTGATDDTSAIQSAIDSVSDINGTIVFSTGTYKVTTSKTIPSNINTKVEKGAILYTDRSIRTTDYKWTQSTKSQLVEDCEDAWDESVDADVTSSTDTADYKVGSASVKLVVGDDVAAGDILATEAITSLDISGYTYIKLWIKSSVATADGDLQLLLDDTTNCASPLETIDIPALSIDTWTQVELPFANRSNDTAIISVGLKCAVDIGTCTIHIDNLQATSPYEYYLEATAGGDPEISEPTCCTENGSELTEGTAGTLAVGEWDWADNDSLGYNTVYIRLSDNEDPDGKATDYVKAGYKLTLNGPFSAGLYQVFSGDGSVSFEGSDNIVIYPQWWGARGTATAPGNSGSSNDETIKIQAALDAGTNRTVYFPKQTGSYYLTGQLFPSDNTKIVFAPGVVIQAVDDLSQPRPGESIFTLLDSNNVVIDGNYATLQMNKSAYSSEWNHGISLEGTTNIIICNLVIKDTGGDGIFVGSDLRPGGNENVFIENVICDSNRRQGMSVTSVDGLTVINCHFRNTTGTDPSAGVDIEPSTNLDTIKNIKFTGCTSSNNDGAGFFITLEKLDNTSPGPISISFDSCISKNNDNAGFSILNIADDILGTISIRNCIAKENYYLGYNIARVSGVGPKITIEDCVAINCNTSRNTSASGSGNAAFYVRDYTDFIYSTFGNVDFVRCSVIDTQDTPYVEHGFKTASFNAIPTNIRFIDCESSGQNGAKFSMASNADATQYIISSNPLERSNVNVSTSGVGEDDLQTYTLPAGQLGNHGVLHIIASGVKHGSNDNKQLKFYFGPSSIIFHAAANNINDWYFEAWIGNTNYNNQYITWRGYDGTTLLQGFENWVIDTRLDTIVKITGECSDASDYITQMMWFIEQK
ncbi:MAG: hypothetical protein J7K15_02725 [Deltaproteobacteria bacterium]|nr:hypothetical protein [Deltaproteobacteria bacterium]